MMHIFSHLHIADLAIHFRDMPTSGSSGHQQGAPGWVLDTSQWWHKTQRSECSERRLCAREGLPLVTQCAGGTFAVKHGMAWNGMEVLWCAWRVDQGLADDFRVISHTHEPDTSCHSSIGNPSRESYCSHQSCGLSQDKHKVAVPESSIQQVH